MPLTLDHGPEFTLSDMLHIPAEQDAPIACDMSTARDTPAERLDEYRRLFERALLRRERTGDGVVFVFRDEAEVRDTVEDLVRREAACCPFLEYRVETAGDELVWTTSSARASEILDEFYALPANAGSSAGELLASWSTRLDQSSG